MRIPHAILPAARIALLAVFGVLCLGVFGYLLVNSGGRLPVISKEGYRVSLDFPKVSNLVYDSDVMMAGVPIGKVIAIQPEGDHAHVQMQLDSNYPLHQGATVSARNKTLVQETYLDIKDGPGTSPPVNNGTQLPNTAAKPAVELNEVLKSLDKPTRDALGSAVRSLGGSTQQRRNDLSASLAGVGALGRNGGTVLDALADQSNDLRSLTGKTATLLSALDTRQGQIAQLVSDANTLTKTTADSNQQIQSVVGQLPGLLTTTRQAGDGLNTLSSSLDPVAANLSAAAPDLSKALQQLPGASRDLRGLVPPLNSVVESAPNTLRRTPAVSSDLDQTASTVNVNLSDVNPTLSYLKPYGRDIAAFFTNVGQALNRGDANGKTLRLFTVYNEQTVKGVPLDFNKSPLNKSNAYPKPGSATTPGPFNGKYPRVEPDPPR